MAERAEEPIAGTTDPALQGRRRVLALEIRSGRMGYAVFEDMELIDWGTRWFRGKTSSSMPCVSARIRDLLTTYRPAVVAVRERKYPFASGNKRFVMMLGVIRKEAKRQRAKFTMLSAHSVERYFAALGCTTKYTIATNLAQRFEHLSWKLPKPRKSYESEAPFMTVFDAVATGLTFVEKNADTPITP
jgi:hypothetical protein